MENLMKNIGQHSKFSITLRQSLGFRLAVLFVSLLLFSGIVLMFSLYAFYQKRIEIECKNKVSELSKITASFLDGETVDRYLSTLEKDERYDQILANIRAIVRESSITYLCVTRIFEDREVFVFDDTDEDYELHMKLGEVAIWDEDEYIEELTPYYLAGKRVEPFIQKTRWGTLLTANEPILRADGTTAAYASASILMDEIWHERQSAFVNCGFASALFVISFTVVWLYALQKSVIRPLRRLTDGIRDFSPGVSLPEFLIQSQLKQKKHSGSELDALEHVLIEIILHIDNMFTVLKESEEQTKLMLDAAPIASQLRDLNNKIIDCNEEALRLFGASSKEEYIASFFNEYMPEFQPSGERSQELSRKVIEESFRDKKRIHLTEWHYKTSTGEILPCEVTSVRAKHRGEDVVVLYARDLREQQKAIEAANKVKIAEANNKAKSDFLATISHEMRTPLNAIIGIAEIQLQKNSLPIEIIGALEKIHNSGYTLLSIINDILDLSKIGAGSLELRPAEYYVASLINDAAQVNMVRIGSKRIEFILDVDENLPEKLIGDELRLKQILHNLLSNAIKYTEEGYVRLSVNCQRQEKETQLVFIVEDTGQGIKAEDQASLFMEFSRLNTNKNQVIEGTGLGLAITKRLVELMGGTIQVESQFNKGSKFTATVKQGTVECENFGPIQAKQLENFSFIRKKQSSRIHVVRESMPYGKVLLVDDVETNLYVAEGMLIPYELTVEKVRSGIAAIEKVQNGNTYDIIFMDQMMPGMSGLEATQQLRGLGYDGVIVALTANALVGNDEVLKQHGFDDFISKPVDMRYLNTILNKYIRDKHSSQIGKYMPKIQEATLSSPQTAAMSMMVFDAFRRDAKSAIKALRQAVDEKNMEVLITTVHGMKSALLSIGEFEKSQQALELEEACGSNNMDYVLANIDVFIELLESFVIDIPPR